MTDTESVADLVERFETRLAEVEAELRVLRNAAVPEDGVDAPPAAKPTPDAPGGTGDQGGLSRRRALALGTAGTGVVALAALGPAAPAAADHLPGFGHTNLVGNATTIINGTGPSILQVEQEGDDGWAIIVHNSSQTTPVPTVYATNDGSGAAVEGWARHGPGLHGHSRSSNAVTGQIDEGLPLNSFNAVYGTTKGNGNGVFGEVLNTSNTANAVLGIHAGPGNSVFGFKNAGVPGDGVVGLARTGRGVWGISEAIGVQAQGTRAPLYLVPGGASAPTTGAHQRGEVYVDSAGGFWACVTSGTPGVWRKLAAPGAAGVFHLLPTPARVYDSRPGTLPTQGPKTPLPAGNIARTIDLKLNNSGVPAGATGALVTVLLVNATSGQGNFTIWANDKPKPLSNTMVWGGDAGRFTVVATTALSPNALVKIDASLQTNVVLDVVGYFR